MVLELLGMPSYWSYWLAYLKLVVLKSPRWKVKNQSVWQSVHLPVSQSVTHSLCLSVTSIWYQLRFYKVKYTTTDFLSISLLSELIRLLPPPCHRSFSRLMQEQMMKQLNSSLFFTQPGCESIRGSVKSSGIKKKSKSQSSSHWVSLSVRPSVS